MNPQEQNDGPDRDFIEHVVKQIVDNPDEVNVSRSVDEMGVLITLQVAKEDMGKIIGKNGQTAKALRILLRVIGSKNNARVNLRIIEPEGSEVAPEESSQETEEPALESEEEETIEKI